VGSGLEGLVSNRPRANLYDADSITRPSKSIVRVWVKLEYTDRGVIEMVKNVGKNAENLSHAVALDEITVRIKNHEIWL